MRGKWLLLSFLLLGLMLGAVVGLSLAQGAEPDDRSRPRAPVSTPAVVGTSFTYQGRLTDGGSPAEGEYDLRFELFSAASGGTLLGTATKDDLLVSSGLFTVKLDFGPVFTGTARYLQIGVRPGASTAAYTPLLPRQALTPAPYALALAGLWTRQNNTSPNLIGGYWGNSAADGVVGATISGGGSSDNPNRVEANYATVGGGHGNTANALYATVGGGWGNIADGNYATVGGGWGNIADGNYATVGGGQENTASGYWATVGGGQENTASGHSATVSGGYSNTASYDHATVGGGYGNTAIAGDATVGGGQDNTAYGGGATVGGGGDNSASVFATVGGGQDNTASGFYSTIGGGSDNTASGRFSFAAGLWAQANHDGTFVWAGCGDHCADPSNADPLASTVANQFLVRADGGAKVMKGTSTFLPVYAALHVENAIDGGEAAWLRVSHASNPHAVLKLLKHPDASANFVEGKNLSAGPETQKFHIDQNGTYHAGSDFAEALPAVGHKDDYEPGDVLVISLVQPGAVEKCTRPYDGAVVGVYSTRPGFVGADKDGATEVWPGEIPVAVMGIVPVKVSTENGPIRPGDLLATASIPGHAMRCEGLELCFGRTLGKALEGLDGAQDTGVIRMLVMLQ
jgi:hypothetical protein